MADPAAQARTHRVLADRTRARLLSLLRDAADPLDVQALAAATDLHPSTVRGHLEQLVDAGFVSAAPEWRRTRGRPRTLYQAVRDAPLSHDADGYRQLAAVLARTVADASDDPAAAAAAAGEAWGRQLAQGTAPAAPPTAAEARERLVTLLADLGFGPAGAGDEVRLRRCPFLDVARATPEVVCSVHLGLMRGALAAWRAPLATTALEPFADATACIARLAERG